MEFLAISRRAAAITASAPTRFPPSMSWRACPVSSRGVAVAAPAIEGVAASTIRAATRRRIAPNLVRAEVGGKGGAAPSAGAAPSSPRGSDVVRGVDDTGSTNIPQVVAKLVADVLLDLDPLVIQSLERLVQGLHRLIERLTNLLALHVVLTWDGVDIVV